MGLPPIRSPAETTTEAGFARFALLIVAARYAAPPAGTQPGPRLVPVFMLIDRSSGSRWPWKSLIARIWAFTRPDAPALATAGTARPGAAAGGAATDGAGAAGGSGADMKSTATARTAVARVSVTRPGRAWGRDIADLLAV